jgi:hypothetical protein
MTALDSRPDAGVEWHGPVDRSASATTGVGGQRDVAPGGGE